jgi:hypothetical protein
MKVWPDWAKFRHLANFYLGIFKDATALTMVGLFATLSINDTRHNSIESH